MVYGVLLKKLNKPKLKTEPKDPTHAFYLGQSPFRTRNTNPGETWPVSAGKAGGVTNPYSAAFLAQATGKARAQISPEARRRLLEEARDASARLARIPTVSPTGHIYTIQQRLTLERLAAQVTGKSRPLKQKENKLPQKILLGTKKSYNKNKPLFREERKIYSEINPFNPYSELFKKKPKKSPRQAP